MLLAAINEITDNIKADTDKKLEDFVRQNVFADLVKEQGGLYRRVQNLEKETKDIEDQMHQNIQKIDDNRKKTMRQGKDIDAIKNMLKNGDFKMPENDEESEEHADPDQVATNTDSIAKLQTLI